MASIHLQGILVDSVGEIDVGGVITFTHLTTTGDTIASTQTELIIPPDGAYSIDVEYGQIRIDYTTRNTERFVANVIVNSASTATSLPELLSATTPVAKPIIIQMQGLVADATAAATTAEAFADQLTTTELIASSATFSPNTNITTKGYTTSGDGGAGSWVQNGVTGQTVSQSPAQLGNALLNDASGNQWGLVGSGVSYPAKGLGVVGDGISDDTLAIQAGLNAGVVTGANLTCKITSRLLATLADSGIEGSIKLVGVASLFNREDGLYDNTNGTILKVGVSGFILDGVTIKLDSNSNGENTTTALLLRSANDFKIINCDFNTFSNTKVIRVEDCDDGVILHSKIHSCLMDSATTGQLTAIDIDDNRPSTTFSKNIEVAHCVIYNMLVSAAFKASFGYQTDGINISNQGSYGHNIHSNSISYVGEAIDCFGTGCSIHNNNLSDLFDAGIKIINGATRNNVYANTVSRARTFGIGVFGAASAGIDTVGNLIYKNHIIDTNINNDATNTSAPIQIADNSGASLPKENTFSDNSVHNCSNADRVVINESVDTSNAILNTKVTGSVTSTLVQNLPDSPMTFADKTIAIAYPSAQSIAVGGGSADLANVVTDSNSELSGAVFTAKYPKTVNINGSIRTAAANLGKFLRLSIIKNGAEFSRSEVVCALSGDLYSSISLSGVRLSEGDTINFYINHNDVSPLGITSDGLYTFSITES